MKKFSITLIILIILTIATTAYSDEFKLGIRAFSGGHEFKPSNFTTEENDYHWASMSLLLTTKINDYFDYSNSFGLGLLGARSASAPTIEYRLLLRVKFYGIYLQTGGGLAYGCNSKDIPNIGPSPLLGIISVELGYEFNNSFSIGYAWEHISDPFFDDGGWNVGALALTIRF